MPEPRPFTVIYWCDQRRRYRAATVAAADPDDARDAFEEMMSREGRPAFEHTWTIHTAFSGDYALTQRRS